MASLPSSSSVTYTIGCFVISRPYVALQAISHWFKRLILQSAKFSCRMEGVLARLLLPDSAQIAAATADLRTAFKQVKINCERELKGRLLTNFVQLVKF